MEEMMGILLVIPTGEGGDDRKSPRKPLALAMG